MQPSKRSFVEPFRAMQVVDDAGALARAGRDIVMMCVGQPGAPAPLAARKAAEKALSHGKIGYTSAPGTDALRRRITGYYADRYGVSLSFDRVFVTTGSSAAFMLAFLSGFDVGDRVAIPSPGYPAYRNILRTLSLEPVEIETTAASDWVITPELAMQAHAEKPIDGILIANPNNPNGTMSEPADFRLLMDACRENSIKFISDEIYHGLTYAKPEISALEVDDDVIVINSFSKYFCMTGWRIGWMIVPEDMIETVNRLQQNAFICAPEISQIAALAAFDGLEELETVKQGYLRNRDYIVRNLRALGIEEFQPIDGAFYAYANVKPLLESASCANSMQLARRILQEAGVALTPGIDFDTKRGNDWMRFSFACEEAELVKGIARIEAWLSGDRPGPQAT